jgi:hypothetical protein
LGLLAVSGLWDRNRRLKRIEELSEESRDLVKRFTGKRVRAEDFYQSGRQLSGDALRSANTILISGITLVGTTKEYSNILIQRLQANARIRIIIVEPEESVLQQIVFRSWGETTADYYLSRLETVEELINNIRKITGGSGKIELGHLPFIPAFGMVMLDPDQPHGICYVEIYHHRSAEPSPAFTLRAADDPLWFEFFRKQFGLLWEACRVETGSGS